MANEIVKYADRFAADAAKYAEQHQAGGGSFLSTRAGVLRAGEDELPGNQMAVIVLDSILENTYYPGKFDPDMPEAPSCYAFGRRVDEMAPHESMQQDPGYFKPEAEDCASCPMNVWGSADQGKGKACKNRARLALIPAGYYEGRRGSRDLELNLFNDPQHYREADEALLKLPPTSVAEWSKYVQFLAATHRRAPYAVITRVYLEPHEKHQYHVKFELIELVPDELAEVIIARHEAAAANIITPYTPPQEREEPKRQQRGLRR